MKTSTWQPSSAHVSDTAGRLGLTQRLVVTGRGHQGMELSAIAALVMTIAYMRANVEVSITTLEGVELAYSRAGQLNGEQDIMQALFLMDQALISERKLAVRETLDDVAKRAGLRFEGDIAVPIDAPSAAAPNDEGSDEGQFDDRQAPQLRSRPRNRRG